MKTLSKIIDKVFYVSNFICRFMLCVIFGVMWLIVFGRYFFGKTPVWGEELILFCMCWVSILSGADAFRNDLHLRLSVIDHFLSEKTRDILTAVLDVIATGVIIYLIPYGIKSVVSNLSIKYSGLKIGQYWLYLSLPIGFVLIILGKADKYIKLYLGRQAEKEAAQ